MLSRGSIARLHVGAGILSAALVVGCGTGSPGATASAVPTIAVPSDPLITLSAPAQVSAGQPFKVSWTGAETSGDFFVIVPAGATTWTETPDSPHINATIGNPATLTAPKSAGAYEVWFLKGDMEGVQIIKARAAITVT
jgi:hypothetical protein